MRNGPEFGRGWRARYETEVGVVSVEARHYERRRLPRAYEMARQIGRGRPLEMVPDPIHEWSMQSRGLPPATVRATPDGRFHTHALPRAFDDMKGLAEAWGEHMALRTGRAARPDEELADPEAPSGPRP